MTSTELQGKWALVTGASSGLGVDFARELATRGANLILLARREDLLKGVAEEIRRSYQVEVEVVPLDLSLEDSPRFLYERLTQEGKTVDILINNAGFGVYGEHSKIPWDRERQMLQVDIITLAHLTKLFLGDMLSRNFGYIMQISSVAAYQPSPTYSCYGAAKSFVLFFGEALNYELRNTDVSCTVLSPGITATEFLKVAGQTATLYQRLLMMQSEEVARIGIKAMLKRRPSVIPGMLNSILAWTVRFTPRRLSAAIAHRMMTLG